MITYKEAIKKIWEGHKFEDLQILSLKEGNGVPCTVAQYQLSYGWRTKDSEILKLVTGYLGNTIAHEQAFREYFTEDLEILLMRNYVGVSVYTVQLLKGWKPRTKRAKALIIAERLKE